jgi:hypothetical protein
MPERLPATRTPVSAGIVGGALSGMWRDATGEDPTPAAVRLLLAQSALETGRWASCWNFNLGNAKSTPGDGFDWTYFACNEVVSPSYAARLVAAAEPREDDGGPNAVVTGETVVDGTPKAVVWLYPDHPGSRFRAWRTLADGARDYLRMMRRRYERTWPAVMLGDPRGFVRALKLAGYFTAAEQPYADAVESLFREYQGIDVSPRVDRGAVSAAIAETSRGTIAELLAEDARKREDG